MGTRTRGSAGARRWHRYLPLSGNQAPAHAFQRTVCSLDRREGGAEVAAVCATSVGGNHTAVRTHPHTHIRGGPGESSQGDAGQ